MNSLKDKIVFITGASSGIGASCAKKFAEHKCRLLLAARRIDRLNSFAEELRGAYGVEILTVHLDVRRPGDVDKVVRELPARWKHVSVLVNNAGLSRGLDPIQEGNINDWDEMIDTNIKGLLYTSRSVLPGMIKRNEGHVINIGSTAGHTVYPKGNVYNATKFAVNALTQGMKMDLLGSPIRITSIDPGLVETEFSIVRFHGDKQRADKTYEGMTPLTPDDVADAVVWCATRPPHVNVQEILLMPTDQASPTLVHRKATSVRT